MCSWLPHHFVLLLDKQYKSLFNTIYRSLEYTWVPYEQFIQQIFSEIICPDTGVDQMCAHRPKNSFQKLKISMFTFIAMIVILKLYLLLKLKYIWNIVVIVWIQKMPYNHV